MEENDDSILCEDYQIYRTQVFVNDQDDVVIKQENGFYSQEMLVFINPAYIQKLINMLYECQNQILSGE